MGQIRFKIWDGVACTVSEGGVTVTAQLTFRKNSETIRRRSIPFLRSPAFFICADCYTEIIMNDEITRYIDSGQSTCCGMRGELINMLWVAEEFYSNVRVGSSSVNSVA